MNTRRSPSRHMSWLGIGVLIVVALGAVLAVFPFYWMFASSTRTSADVLAIPPRWDLGAALLTNLETLSGRGYWRAMWNSAFIAVTTTLGTLLIASMAGFAFARYSFVARDAIFAVFLATLIVPPQVTVVPLFELMARAGWLGSPWAIILPGLAGPFSVFFMRQAFMRFPPELIDAGRIDGASEWLIFWRIALPTVRPSLAALGIFVFLGQWNSFFWPLVALNRPESHTLPVAISSLIGENSIDYGALILGTALSVLPVLVLFLMAQRHFVSGALSGSVKQ